MSGAFMTVFLVYAAYAVVLNRRKEVEHAARKPSKLTLVLQTPLFFLALYYGYHHGVLSRDLVSPLSIGFGLILGHFLFGLSLLVTHQELGDAKEHILDLHALWHFLVENPALLFRFLAVSITEELIYRVAAQPLLIDWLDSPAAGIAVVALCFSVIHWHFFRNPVIQSAEFLGFALLLGLLYHWTGSFSLVVTIHTVRNLEIVYLEYLVKLSELGDEEQAMREVERLYVHRPPEPS